MTKAADQTSFFDDDSPRQRPSQIAPEFGVSDAVALFNQILETATPTITVVGEVANFKVNQGKWVFFDIKDDGSSLGCFMSLFNLHTSVEDGMKVAVTARPTITKWGKFSLTVQRIRPVGEGSIKRAFELLQAKLDREGLFAPERKRALPSMPAKIGVISSIDAAGYQDFIKILSSRFGNLEIVVTHVQVQGDQAAEQIMAALSHHNQMASPPEVVAILRGGGSRDDLATFDDERLVRAIALSRLPTITGIGHEIDLTLADLAADVRASTPSNAAEILVPDRRALIAGIDSRLAHLLTKTENQLKEKIAENDDRRSYLLNRLERLLEKTENQLKNLQATLKQLNPKTVLSRVYAILRGKNGQITLSPTVGEIVQIETAAAVVGAKVVGVTIKDMVQ
jgi:exodeoxyribonuclease VII large subunit